MTAPTPKVLRDLSALARRITGLDDKLEQARDVRRDLIRQAAEEGIPRKDIAAAANVSRQAIERALPTERVRKG